MRSIKLVIAYFILIAIWQMIYVLNVEILETWKSYSFPSPLGVIESLVRLISSGILLTGLAVSLQRIVIGFILAALLGILLGVILTKFKIIRQNYSAVFLGIQTLPSICWIPFAILWFGLTEKTIMFVMIIGASTSIALATEAGINGINPIYIKAARNLGAKGTNLYCSVIFPAASPQILLGLKQGWSFAFRGLMAGEMLAASVGIGQILTSGREMADINQVAAVIFIVIILGLLVDQIAFNPLEKIIRIKWGLETK